MIDFTKFMQQNYYSPSQALNCYVLSLIQIIGDDAYQRVQEIYS